MSPSSVTSIMDNQRYAPIGRIFEERLPVEATRCLVASSGHRSSYPGAIDAALLVVRRERTDCGTTRQHTCVGGALLSPRRAEKTIANLKSLAPRPNSTDTIFVQGCFPGINCFGL